MCLVTDSLFRCSLSLFLSVICVRASNNMVSEEKRAKNQNNNQENFGGKVAEPGSEVQKRISESKVVESTMANVMGIMP